MNMIFIIIFQLNDNNSNIEYLKIFDNDDDGDKNDDDDDNDDDNDDGSDNDIDTPKQRLHNLEKTNYFAKPIKNNDIHYC